MEKVQGQSIFQRTAYKTRQNTRARFLTHACVLSRSMCAIPLDHHLTTPSFQPVLYIVFYAPTFFYNHHKQRRKLCTPHNFRRRIIVFAIRHSSPTRKAAGSNPVGRTTKRPLCENTAAFSWYFKFSANGKPSGILCADQISALAASRQRSNFPGIPLPAIHPVFTP